MVFRNMHGSACRDECSLKLTDTGVDVKWSEEGKVNKPFDGVSFDGVKPFPTVSTLVFDLRAGIDCESRCSHGDRQRKQSKHNIYIMSPLTGLGKSLTFELASLLLTIFVRIAMPSSWWLFYWLLKDQVTTPIASEMIAKAFRGYFNIWRET